MIVVTDSKDVDRYHSMIVVYSKKVLYVLSLYICSRKNVFKIWNGGYTEKGARGGGVWGVVPRLISA